LKYLLITILYFPLLIAQPVITVVDSSSGHPIAGAVISDGIHSVITASSGSADISTLNPGGILLVTAEGYHSLKIEWKSAVISAVRLLPLADEKGEVLIKGTTSPGISVFDKKVDLSILEGEGYAGLPELVKRNFSLFVKEYGGAGSLKQASYRGLSPENSLVLFNGIRVNDIRSGGYDLSMVSTGDLSTAGFASLVSEGGEISPGGVLSLGTGPAPRSGVTLAGRMDNTGMFSFAGNGTVREGGFSLAVSGERAWSPNRFSYEFEGKVRARENAHFNRTFVSVAAGQAYKNFSADIYSNYTFFSAGVPGFVVSNNTSSSEAVSNTEGSLNIIRLRGMTKQGVSLELSAGYNHQRAGLDDPNTARYREYGTEKSTLNSFSINTSAVFPVFNSDFTLGYSFEKGDLSDIKTVLSNQRRESSVSRTTHRFILKAEKVVEVNSATLKSIGFTAGLNATIFDQKGIGERSENPLSWSAGLALIPGFYEKLSLRANIFSGKRVPTYNEYYYSSLFSAGNLKPESFKGFEAGISVQKPGLFIEMVSISYYDISTDDKIIWVPSIIGLQIPRNVSSTGSRGFDVSVEAAVKSAGLSLLFTYSRLEASNISPFGSADGSHGKQLVYTPKERINSSLSWKSDLFKIILDHRFTGLSYFTADNDPLFYLGANNVFDLHVSCFVTLLKSTNTLSLSVFNLFNENYKVIQSYPMPLRTFVISLTTKLWSK